MFGSIVQNGKFAACALAFVKQLNSVDFPTFGKPTIPHFSPIFFNFFAKVTFLILFSMHLTIFARINLQDKEGSFIMRNMQVN